jgi:hypothetical protein
MYDRRRDSLLLSMFLMKPRRIENDLPLIAISQRHFYQCPHCGNAVTFSQLGHAHRWGWCPRCAADWNFDSPFPILPSYPGGRVGDSVFKCMRYRVRVGLLPGYCPL